MQHHKSAADPFLNNLRSKCFRCCNCTSLPRPRRCSCQARPSVSRFPRDFTLVVSATRHLTHAINDIGAEPGYGLMGAPIRPGSPTRSNCRLKSSLLRHGASGLPDLPAFWGNGRDFRFTMRSPWSSMEKGDQSRSAECMTDQATGMGGEVAANIAAALPIAYALRKVRCKEDVAVRLDLQNCGIMVFIWVKPFILGGSKDSSSVK